MSKQLKFSGVVWFLDDEMKDVKLETIPKESIVSYVSFSLDRLEEMTDEEIGRAAVNRFEVIKRKLKEYNAKSKIL